MKTARGSLILIAAAIAAACTSGPPPPVDERPYDEQIASFRAEKDLYFRTSADSPLKPEDRAGFTGLSYFPVDRSLRVTASLREESANPPLIIDLQTTGLSADRVRKVGSLGFMIGGETYALTAFAPADARTVTRLFVPFGDATGGQETYKGGRYLDLTRTVSGVYDLDFNRAYHPNCVYDVRWVCPIPPRENRLEIPIRAGERLPPS